MTVAQKTRRGRSHPFSCWDHCVQAGYWQSGPDVEEAGASADPGPTAESTPSSYELKLAAAWTPRASGSELGYDVQPQKPPVPKVCLYVSGRVHGADEATHTAAVGIL